MPRKLAFWNLLLVQLQAIRSPVFAYPVEFGVAWKSEQGAARLGHLDAARELITHGAIANLETGSDIAHNEVGGFTGFPTALRAAAQSGHATGSLLLANGAKSHAAYELAPHMAAYFGHVDMNIQLLTADLSVDSLQEKADPHGASSRLDKACRKARIPVDDGLQAPTRGPSARERRS
ncbi:hypothetical protein HDU90_006435 [Geranomyces variabilis]|nr:hypothetical protein HDU90_006435 [Geranomyces variabilis]